MKINNFGLVAAMPDETRPFLKLVGKYTKTVVDGFSLYRFNFSGKQCGLIESGIGVSRAGRAAAALIKSVNPGFLISFGFGGAVRPGLSVGDLAVAARVMFYRDDPISTEDAILVPDTMEVMRLLADLCKRNGCSIMPGEFITSDRILNKKVLVETLPPDLENPVLDMETWAIAQMAADEDIPFLAIRAVSDAADEELDFSLDQFTDSEMNIRISRVLRAIMLKPTMIPQLLRLARNSKTAGRNLAMALDRLLAEMG